MKTIFCLLIGLMLVASIPISAVPVTDTSPHFFQSGNSEKLHVVTAEAYPIQSFDFRAFVFENYQVKLNGVDGIPNVAFVSAYAEGYSNTIFTFEGTLSRWQSDYESYLGDVYKGERARINRS